MNFNWTKAKERGIASHIRQNKSKSKASNNPQFRDSHPDWCRDAQGKNPNYAVLVKKTTEEIQKFQQRAEDRRKKILGQ